MFVEPGAEELKEQALASVGDSHLLVESVSVGAVEAVEAKCKSKRKEDSCEEKTTSQHAKREKERGKQPNYAGRRRWPGRQVAMKASKGTRMKGNCTLGVRGESAWRCKRGAAWGKQLRGKGFGAAGKSSGGARVKSAEGVRKSAITQKVNDTSSGGNESECGESGCAADGQKGQQKKEGDKKKHPGVQLVHRGGSMLGVEGVDGRRIEIEFVDGFAGDVSSERGGKLLRMEYDGGGSQGFAKALAEGGVIEFTFFQGGVGEVFVTAKQGGLKNFMLEIGFVRGDRAMFAVELADEEYHVAKGICEVGQIGRGDNFDTNGECERVMDGVLGDLPKCVLGCDIDDMFCQRGEVHHEVVNNACGIIITKSVGAGCEVKHAGRDLHGVEESWKVGLCLEIGYAQGGGMNSSCNMAEDTVGAGGVAASNIAVMNSFVLESFNKINKLFEMVVAGSVPNFKSIINSLGLDAGAYSESDNCDKNEKQKSCSKRCARNINGIEKGVDAGAGVWERINGVGFGVKVSKKEELDGFGAGALTLEDEFCGELKDSTFDIAWRGGGDINSVLERGRFGASVHEGGEICGGGDLEITSGSTGNAFVCCALRGGASAKTGEVVVMSEECTKLSKGIRYCCRNGGEAIYNRNHVRVRKDFAQDGIMRDTTEDGIIAGTSGGASCIEDKEISLNKENGKCATADFRLRLGRKGRDARQEGNKGSVDSVDESKKENEDAKNYIFVNEAGAKVDGFEIESNAGGVRLRQDSEVHRDCSGNGCVVIKGKKEEGDCGAGEVCSFECEDLFGDCFVREDEVRKDGGVWSDINGASSGGAEVIKCGGESGGKNNVRPKSRSAQARWRLEQPQRVMFGDISVGTVRGVSCRRVYLKGGRQREHASHGVQEKFEGSDEIARRELVVDRDSSVEEIAREKQGGSKVNEVIELEAGVDAKGVGGENSNKSGARVTETVKRIASGTRRNQQSEGTGVNQESEDTGMSQQSEGTG